MCDEGQGHDSEDVEGLVMVARHSSSDGKQPCDDLITFEVKPHYEQFFFFSTIAFENTWTNKTRCFLLDVLMRRYVET